jgi:hypothetical protein
MFCDSQSSFEGDVSTNFKVLINTAHDNISLRWIIDLNTCIDYLAFEFVSQHIWATFINHIGALVFVTRDVYGDVVASMKQQCQEVATQLITTELQSKFPTPYLMDALRIIYPQYWL